VAAVVVLALVAWVIVVVTRAPPLQGPPALAPRADKADPATPAPSAPLSGPAAQAPEGSEGADKASEPAAPRDSRPLDAHLEIQDEKPGGDKTGRG
jgi:hypothetical protein